MGTIDLNLAVDLRDRLKLQRAIETGTYRGVTARAFSSLFDSVVTIEISSTLHERAATALSDLPHVEALLGHSAQVLDTLVDQDVPTLYFLDGHWSGGITDGAEDECPVLAEIAAIGTGHPDDCMIIDDARLFVAAPPAPLHPEQWPTLIDIFDAVRREHPEHMVTLVDDQVIAVPERAKPAIDAYAARVHNAPMVRLHALARAVRGRTINAIAAMRGVVTRKR